MSTVGFGETISYHVENTSLASAALIIHFHNKLFAIGNFKYNNSVSRLEFELRMSEILSANEMLGTLDLSQNIRISNQYRISKYSH